MRVLLDGGSVVPGGNINVLGNKTHLSTAAALTTNNERFGDGSKANFYFLQENMMMMKHQDVSGEKYQ